MDPGTAFAVVQFADQCLKYGEKLVRRCQNYRHAEEESRALMITIEVNWMKTEAQITFLKKISSALDPRYQDVQSRVLSELEGKLKTATLTMDQLITHQKDLPALPQPAASNDKPEAKKERDPDFPKMVKALEKIHPRKKVKYAFKKESLEKIIDDLENWQKRFDPSWMLIMRMADEKIDAQLRDEEMKPQTRRAGFIMAAKGVRDAARESTPSGSSATLAEKSEGSIFVAASVLEAGVVEVQNSSAVLARLVDDEADAEVQAEEVLVDTMVCNPIADVQRTTRDVRRLARILSSVDPSTFGLLVCRGVIKPPLTSSFSSSIAVPPFSTTEDAQAQNPDAHPTFHFLFAIPPSLSHPKSLRTLLLESDGSVPLNSRFDLAKQLTNSVMFVHSSQFVHKNIRPETIIVFEHDGKGEGEGKGRGKGLGRSFLVGFEKFRPAEGMTYRVSDGIWQHDLYRHPSRQGTQPEEDYQMQHDIYSLGVVLLELGLWQSFITYHNPPPEDAAGSKPTPTAIPPHFMTAIFTAAADPALSKDTRRRATAIKAALIALAASSLPAKMGQKYTDVVLLCLRCLDAPLGAEGRVGSGDGDETEGDEGPGAGAKGLMGEFDDVYDEDGIVVGVKYIERILLRMQEISI